MAAKTGAGVAQVVDTIEGLFRDWENRAASLNAKFSSSQSISIDVVVNAGFHEARRALNKFDAMQSRIQDKSWGAAVRAEGVARHGVGYDIIAETQAFRTLLIELKTVIVTAVGGVDADGYLNAKYVKLSDSPPFFNTVSATDYAPVVAKLQEIINSIES